MSKVELVIVLAAGEGTRMKSKSAKVLHEIAGRTIIENLLAAVKPLEAKNLTVVVGSHKDEVIEHLSKIAPKAKTVFQENLSYYAEYDETNVESIFSDIERSLLMYDQIVKTSVRYDDETYATNLKDEYVTYLKLFDFLIEEE